MFAQVIVDEECDPVAQTQAVGRVSYDVGLGCIGLASDAVYPRDRNASLLVLALALALALVFLFAPLFTSLLALYHARSPAAVIAAAAAAAAAAAIAIAIAIATRLLELAAQKLTNLATPVMPISFAAATEAENSSAAAVSADTDACLRDTPSTQPPECEMSKPI